MHLQYGGESGCDDMLIVNNEGELQFELNQNAWKLNNIIEWK